MKIPTSNAIPIALACTNLIVGASAAAITCQTESQPNPISNTYPNDTTGTINGTTAIIPIPYAVARQIIPSQYGILTHAYESLIPNLPKGTYPAVLEALLDHDVGRGDIINIPDFQRIALKFPFVDRLNDGYSSFKYTSNQLVSLNPVALVGAGLYGSTTLGFFDPSCNPYKYVGDARNGETQSTVYQAPENSLLGSKPAFQTRFKAASGTPYNMDIFKNITNQPSFGQNLPICDNYITLYNTSITQGAFAPVSVKGTVSVRAPYYPTDTVFTEVWGYRMDNAFIERNAQDCQSLKGYTGN